LANRYKSLKRNTRGLGHVDLATQTFVSSLSSVRRIGSRDMRNAIKYRAAVPRTSRAKIYRNSTSKRQERHRAIFSTMVIILRHASPSATTVVPNVPVSTRSREIVDGHGGHPKKSTKIVESHACEFTKSN